MFMIYVHTHKATGRKYIGMTNNPKRRWGRNGAEYKTAKVFYQAIQESGWDSFHHEILEDNLTEKAARKREKFFIELYQTTDPKKGYNTDKGGNGGKVYKVHPRNRLGKHNSEEQNEKHRQFMIDSKNNPMLNGTVKWGETHEHPRGMKGKQHTEEHKKRMAEKMKLAKIRNKAVKAIYPDGETIIFESMKDAEKIGLSKPVILKLIRAEKPFEVKVINQYTERTKHLAGIRFEYA